MITIQHREPSGELTKYVKKISIFDSKEKIKYKQKLTPSVFTYLSFNSKDIPTSIFGGKVVTPIKRLQIAGPKNSEEIFVKYNGKLNQILIEFTASGFYQLFRSSPLKLVNKLSDLDDFIEAQQSNSLQKGLAKFTDVDDQVKILEEFLSELSHSASPPIDYIEKAIKLIDEQKGNININELVVSVNIGKRQFDRKFQEIVGLPPKTYSKIIQLHYVIKLMQAKKYTSMQDISYQAEFYDHAHFTHRFKELTGFSPNEFIKSNKHIALKYFTDLPE